MAINRVLIERVVKSLPIGFYIGRNVDVKFDENAPSAYYDPKEDIIGIGYSIFEQCIDDTNKYTLEEIENFIRGIFYHELSHVMFTPKTYFGEREKTNPLRKQLKNIFEDERIETKNMSRFYGVDFKRNVFVLNNYFGEIPQSTITAFYQTVRFRISNFSEDLKAVNRIIEKYWDIAPNTYNFTDYDKEVLGLYFSTSKHFCETFKMSDLNRITEELTDKKIKEYSSLSEYDQDEVVKIYIDRENPESLKENSFLIPIGNGEGSMKGKETIRDFDAEEAISKAKEQQKTSSRPCNTKLPSNFPNSSHGKKEIPEMKIFYQFVDYQLTEKIRIILEEFIRKTKDNATVIRTYSGSLNYREVGCKDWKIFTQRNEAGNINGYDKFHLNLFIDVSGSFRHNQDKVNTLLKSLDELERSFPFFDYDLVVCSEGEKVLPKKQHYIECRGGNDLDTEIYSIFRTLQKPQRCNYNIALFDGDAYTDYRNSGGERGKTFSAFNNSNTTIISDTSNCRYISTNAPSANLIAVKSGKEYPELLFENIIKAFKKALG